MRVNEKTINEDKLVVLVFVFLRELETKFPLIFYSPATTPYSITERHRTRDSAAWLSLFSP